MSNLNQKQKYNFAYCLKKDHQQSQKRYICLEKGCQQQKQICEFCFKEGNQHSRHTVIASEILLRVAHQKIIFEKITQQIEQIEERVEKLQSIHNSSYMTEALLQLNKLLASVAHFHKKREYNTFQTNAIIELTYQLIAYNRNLCMIKEPLSLKLSEFELQIETVSSILQIVKLEIIQLNTVFPNFDNKYLQFEEYSRYSTSKESSSIDLFKPRKSYSCPKQTKLQPNIQIGSRNADEKTSSKVSTRSSNMPVDFSQEKPSQMIKRTRNKKKQEESYSQQEIESYSLNNAEEDSKRKENLTQNNSNNNMNKQQPLQQLIEKFHYLDEMVVNTTQMQVVERAHEGIIYNMIDLGEGSGNSIKQIVTLGEDGFMKFWNPQNLKCLHVINLKNENVHQQTPVRDIQYLRRIKCLAAICQHCILIINVVNHKIIKRIFVESNNLDSIDQLGLLFLVNPVQKCIQIYDFFSFQQVGQLEGAQEDISSLAYAQLNNKYYYFTGEKNGNLTKYDLDERKYLMHKKVNRITIFYLSTCRYRSGNECLITFSCNEFVNSSYIKIVNIENLDVLQTFTYQAVDSASCYNNEIYLLQSNNNVIQILVDNHISIKKMPKLPSSFGRGADVFNEGLRLVKSNRVAIFSQFTRTQHFSNLIKYPIIQNNSKQLEFIS